MNTELLYQTDFHAWTQQQAHLLKSGQLADADLAHLIEELGSMGASECPPALDTEPIGSSRPFVFDKARVPV